MTVLLRLAWLLAVLGCGPAPAVGGPVAHPSSTTSGPTDDGHRAPLSGAPSQRDQAPPDSLRACTAEPLEMEAEFAPRPLPPGTVTWIAEIDVAMPRIVSRGTEPVVVVPLHPADSRPVEVPVVEARYGAARTLFEHHHWGRAAVRFREIAIHHPEDVGVYAAQLYMESLNLIGTRNNPKRPQCFDALATDNARFLEIYCGRQRKSENVDACDTFGKIERDLRSSDGR